MTHADLSRGMPLVCLLSIFTLLSLVIACSPADSEKGQASPEPTPPSQPEEEPPKFTIPPPPPPPDFETGPGSPSVRWRVKKIPGSKDDPVPVSCGVLPHGRGVGQQDLSRLLDSIAACPKDGCPEGGCSPAVSTACLDYRPPNDDWGVVAELTMLVDDRRITVTAQSVGYKYNLEWKQQRATEMSATRMAPIVNQAISTDLCGELHELSVRFLNSNDFKRVDRVGFWNPDRSLP